MKMDCNLIGVTKMSKIFSRFLGLIDFGNLKYYFKYIPKVFLKETDLYSYVKMHDLKAGIFFSRMQRTVLVSN